MNMFSLRRLMRFFVFSFTFIASLAQAADKIGNGGGVWVCQDPNKNIHDIMFMDVFEAKREYQLNLPESTETPFNIVKVQKVWIEKFLNEPKILKNIEYVEKNITWIEDIINLIPDAANKITPHPSTCKQGDWVAVQLVNFTDDFRILVRRELFESAYMSNLEKAAVYLHEGLYSYLRTEFGDMTSVRTRAIVGYLLSDLPDQEKLKRIEKVLSQASTDPVQQPTLSWICGLKPARFSPLYIFEASTSPSATKGVIESCKKGEDQMPDFPGMPGGGVPGFPGDGFGPPTACKESAVLCEQVTSSTKSKTCTIKTSGKSYQGKGRTQLEAQKEAMNLCTISAGSPSMCYSYDDISCH